MFSKEHEVLQFPGFCSDTPFATDPTTAYIIIKEQMRTRGRQTKFKGEIYQVVLQGEERDFIRDVLHALAELIKTKFEENLLKIRFPSNVRRGLLSPIFVMKNFQKIGLCLYFGRRDYESSVVSTALRSLNAFKIAFASFGYKSLSIKKKK